MTWPATLSLILPLSFPESNAWALTCWEKRNLDFFFFFWTHPAHSLCLLAWVLREKNALETGPKKIKTRKLIRRTHDYVSVACQCQRSVPQWSYWCVEKEKSIDPKINIEASMNWKLIEKKSLASSGILPSIKHVSK